MKKFIFLVTLLFALTISQVSAANTNSHCFWQVENV